jgi:prepilin-type N-terminal cleavage/methylation domain-containing protein
MWKLKTKKGYSLLEVMIALSIFTIIIFCGFSIHLSAIKQKSYNNKLREYMACIELIGNSLQVNYSCSELVSTFGAAVRYVNDENVNIQSLTSGSILSLLRSEPRDATNFISIEISGSDVLKITLQAKYNINGKVETLKNEIYKGYYN